MCQSGRPTTQVVVCGCSGSTSPQQYLADRLLNTPTPSSRLLLWICMCLNRHGRALESDSETSLIICSSHANSGDCLPPLLKRLSQCRSQCLGERWCISASGEAMPDATRVHDLGPVHDDLERSSRTHARTEPQVCAEYRPLGSQPGCPARLTQVILVFRGGRPSCVLCVPARLHSVLRASVDDTTHWYTKGESPAAKLAKVLYCCKE